VVGESWSDLLARQHGIFTARQAAQHGIDKATLADRVADEVYGRVAPATFYCGGPAPLDRRSCGVRSARCMTPTSATSPLLSYTG
jgi:hypothetical protein